MIVMMIMMAMIVNIVLKILQIFIKITSFIPREKVTHDKSMSRDMTKLVYAKIKAKMEKA